MTEKREADNTSFDEIMDTFRTLFTQVEGAIDAGLHEAKLGGIEGARQRLAELEIEDAVRAAKELVEMVIQESNAEPLVEDARALLASLWQRVESGELEAQLRTETLNLLRTLQEELDKHIPPEEGEA